jgi:hypothetical protein
MLLLMAGASMTASVSVVAGEHVRFSSLTTAPGRGYFAVAWATRASPRAAPNPYYNPINLAASLALTLA